MVVIVVVADDVNIVDDVSHCCHSTWRRASETGWPGGRMPTTLTSTETSPTLTALPIATSCITAGTTTSWRAPSWGMRRWGVWDTCSQSISLCWCRSCLNCSELWPSYTPQLKMISSHYKWADVCVCGGGRLMFSCWTLYTSCLAFNG